MNTMWKFAPFDELACLAVIDSPVAEQVQQSYSRLGECLFPEPFFFKLPITPFAGQIRLDPTFLGRPIQDDRRYGPITKLKNLWCGQWPSILGLMQYTEFCLGYGVRLPLPQTIQRGNRLGHEAKTTSGDSGADDDR